MDNDLDLLTALLLDPCLTLDEARREAAVTPRREPRRPDPRRREPEDCRDIRA